MRLMQKQMNKNNEHKQKQDIETTPTSRIFICWRRGEYTEPNAIDCANAMEKRNGPSNSWESKLVW